MKPLRLLLQNGCRLLKGSSKPLAEATADPEAETRRSVELQVGYFLAVSINNKQASISFGSAEKCTCQCHAQTGAAATNSGRCSLEINGCLILAKT